MQFEHNESARERERESTLVTLVAGRAILYITTHGLTATGQRGEEITSLLGAWNQRLRNGECIGYLYFYFKSRDSAKNEGPVWKARIATARQLEKSVSLTSFLQFKAIKSCEAIEEQIKFNIVCTGRTTSQDYFMYPTAFVLFFCIKL